MERANQYIKWPVFMILLSRNMHFPMKLSYLRELLHNMADIRIIIIIINQDQTNLHNTPQVEK